MIDQDIEVIRLRITKQASLVETLEARGEPQWIIDREQTRLNSYYECVHILREKLTGA